MTAQAEFKTKVEEYIETGFSSCKHHGRHDQFQVTYTKQSIYLRCRRCDAVAFERLRPRGNALKPLT